LLALLSLWSLWSLLSLLSSCCCWCCCCWSAPLNYSNRVKWGLSRVGKIGRWNSNKIEPFPNFEGFQAKVKKHKHTHKKGNLAPQFWLCIALYQNLVTIELEESLHWAQHSAAQSAPGASTFCFSVVRPGDEVHSSLDLNHADIHILFTSILSLVLMISNEF
jgi:hypothetical protein